ncbi:hypothetical protein, partial [Rhizobium leguminosarum]|uniref:hypothetical protein n=1 Tax=Rhizobium leguminosarum TaxID=384 RepID=UPI001C8FE06A
RAFQLQIPYSPIAAIGRRALPGWIVATVFARMAPTGRMCQMVKSIGEIDTSVLSVVFHFI